MDILIHADCKDVLKKLIEDGIQVDSIVTDPPYELGFMNKDWDKTGIAYDVELWKLALQVLKPGGHLLSFSSSRTYHRMACAIEDAGFEIRDQIMWIYGQGFPKSLDISKAIDKRAGAEREVLGIDECKAKRNPNGRNTKFIGVAYGVDKRQCEDFKITTPTTDLAKQWQGWGTALKPAHEPIVMARKPLSEKTVAENVVKWDTGGINIDGCRVAIDNDDPNQSPNGSAKKANLDFIYHKEAYSWSNTLDMQKGRFPANLIHDGSEEVEDAFPSTSPSKAAKRGLQHTGRHAGLADLGHNIKYNTNTVRGHNDTGGKASRFFYCAKASAKDRQGSKHPTVKPIALMRYLCRLITPPNGKVLDPFAGTGTTGQAAREEGFNYILIEKESEYVMDIYNRLYGDNKSAKQRELSL